MSAVQVRFVAFLAFEACVGLYFPMMGTLKGDIVPEDMRSTIYNLYRLPLNVIVRHRPFEQPGTMPCAFLLRLRCCLWLTL